jgi:hypothetical protein
VKGHSAHIADPGWKSFSYGVEVIVTMHVASKGYI